MVVGCTDEKDGSNTTVVTVLLTVLFHAGVLDEAVMFVPLHTVVTVSDSLLPSGVKVEPEVMVSVRLVK